MFAFNCKTPCACLYLWGEYAYCELSQLIKGDILGRQGTIFRFNYMYNYINMSIHFIIYMVCVHIVIYKPNVGYFMWIIKHVWIGAKQ